MKARIFESGAGYPTVGSFVTDGEAVYKVESLESETPGADNSLSGDIKLMDWGDVDGDVVQVGLEIGG